MFRILKKANVNGYSRDLVVFFLGYKWVWGIEEIHQTGCWIVTWSWCYFTRKVNHRKLYRVNASMDIFITFSRNSIYSNMSKACMVIPTVVLFLHHVYCVGTVFACRSFFRSSVCLYIRTSFMKSTIMYCEQTTEPRGASFLRTYACWQGTFAANFHQNRQYFLPSFSRSKILIEYIGKFKSHYLANGDK